MEQETTSLATGAAGYAPDRVVGWYSRTKAMASQRVLDAARSLGLNACIVHPSGIMGPEEYAISTTTRTVLQILGGDHTSLQKSKRHERMDQTHGLPVDAACLLRGAGEGEDSVPQTKDGFLRRYWRTIAQGQVDRTHERAIDVRWCPCPPSPARAASGWVPSPRAAPGGPHRLGHAAIGRVAGGQRPLRGFFAVSAKGNHYFADQHSRLSYNLLAQRRVLNFWGISYDACSANPASAYTRRQLRANADYVYAVWPGMKLSASLYVNYTDATRMGDPAYLEGQRPAYFLAGAGLAVEYDTRDFIPQPTRGVYVSVRTIAYPGWAGNFGRTVVSTTAIADAYVSPWRGGVLAADLYGKFNTRNAPWTLCEELGFGGYRMRGLLRGPLHRQQPHGRPGGAAPARVVAAGPGGLGRRGGDVPPLRRPAVIRRAAHLGRGAALRVQAPRQPARGLRLRARHARHRVPNVRGVLNGTGHAKAARRKTGLFPAPADTLLRLPGRTGHIGGAPSSFFFIIQPKF